MSHRCVFPLAESAAKFFTSPKFLIYLGHALSTWVSKYNVNEHLIRYEIKTYILFPFFKWVLRTDLMALAFLLRSILEGGAVIVRIAVGSFETIIAWKLHEYTLCVNAVKQCVESAVFTILSVQYKRGIGIVYLQCTPYL